jgi:hypothetical protein
MAEYCTTSLQQKYERWNNPLMQYYSKSLQGHRRKSLLSTVHQHCSTQSETLILIGQTQTEPIQRSVSPM